MTSLEQTDAPIKVIKSRSKCHVDWLRESGKALRKESQQESGMIVTGAEEQDLGLKENSRNDSKS